MSKQETHFRYAVWRAYINFIHKLYYPHTYVFNKENVPAEGNPNVMVSCHQNCLIDPLTAQLIVNDRKTFVLTRSGAFNGKLVSWFLGKIGLIPIARVDYEGEAAAANNKKSLGKSVDKVGEGHTLILFPEAGHQDKHWLGHFSLMYVRLAFEVAESLDFKKEVYITPFAHHYAHYHHPFYDMMMMFGEPLPLSSFYERYQSKPRTCQREASAIIRERISNLMLDVQDVDNYEAIDYLRESAFGKAYCKKQKLNPNYLPDKLKSDKALVEELAKVDAEKKTPVYEQAVNLCRAIKQNGMRDWLFDAKAPMLKLIAYTLLLAVTALPALACFLATFLVYVIPNLLKKKKLNGAHGKVVDKMFESTFDLGAFAVLFFPLGAVLPAIILMCTWSWLGIFWIPLFLLMVFFVCRFQRLWVKTKGLWNFCVLKKSIAKRLKTERIILFDAANDLLH